MEINEALIKILENAGIRTLFSVKGTVISVDEDTRTCEVEPDNSDANYTGVRLQALESGSTGVVLIPKKGSNVIVHFLDNDEAYVTKTSEITKVDMITENGEIWLNGKDFGGLIKIKELKNELNKNNAILSSVLRVLTGAPITEPGNGSPSALQIALNTALTGKTVGDFSDIENKNVKHG